MSRIILEFRKSWDNKRILTEKITPHVLHPYDLASPAIHGIYELRTNFRYRQIYTQEKKIQHEIALFGFPLSIHPLALYAEWLDGIAAVSANEMLQHVNQRVTMVGWLIPEKPAQTKQGEAMEFIALEDQTGLYDATLFPNTYRRFGHRIRYDRPLIVEGRIEEEFQTVTLTVERLRACQDVVEIWKI